MLQRAYRWLDERLDLRALSRQHLEYPLPAGVNWLHTLGSAALFLFLVQVATGIFLAIYYVPSPDQAYDSVRYLSSRIAFGGFIRGVHYWSANLMVIVLLLHVLRVFFYGAYKKPREVNWVIGVLLLVLVLGFGFTGYLLPWDQKGYWATVVGTNLPRTIPVLGDYLVRFIRGGQEVGAVALARFYAVHTLVLPAFTLSLIAVHLFAMRRVGVAGSWRGEASHGEGRLPFYPDHAAKDATVALVLFGLIVTLA
ncbi:MAG: cytochrome bc complex cytochrome b subunit, partial [Terriglobia bacterium]